MRNSGLVAVVFVSLLGLMAGMRGAGIEERSPAVQFVGHDSRIVEPGYVLVRDEAAWTKLWAEHTGTAESFVPPTRHAAPKVDFSRFIVIGAFNGVGTNTDGLIASSVSDHDNEVVVRFEASSFQTASFGPGEDPGVATSSFGLWVIDKTAKPIILELGKQGLKSEPLRWQEVHRFEPM